MEKATGIAKSGLGMKDTGSSSGGGSSSSGGGEGGDTVVLTDKNFDDLVQIFDLESSFTLFLVFNISGFSISFCCNSFCSFCFCFNCK